MLCAFHDVLGVSFPVRVKPFSQWYCCVQIQNMNGWCSCSLCSIAYSKMWSDRLEQSIPVLSIFSRRSNVGQGYIHSGSEYMLFRGWKVCLVLKLQHLWNDLKCVEWDVKPCSIQSSATNLFVSYCRRVAEAVWIDAGRWLALTEYLVRPSTVLLFSQTALFLCELL